MDGGSFRQGLDILNDNTTIQNGPNGCVTKELVTFTGRLRAIAHKVTFEQKSEQRSDQNQDNCIYPRVAMVLLIYLFQGSGFPI